MCMISLKRIVKEIMGDLPPPAIHQRSASETVDDFSSYIKSVENGRKVGYDKNKKLWFPHKSFEGGMPTIGYGHKVKDNHELEVYKNGISDSKVNNLLLNDLMIANKMVREYIKRKYKVNLVLSQKQNEILVDYAFNLGGLDKFPKFVDAVLKNRWDIARNEYIRKSGGKELTGRNKAFYNRYLRLEELMEASLVKEKGGIIGIIKSNGDVFGKRVYLPWNVDHSEHFGNTMALGWRYFVTSGELDWNGEPDEKEKMLVHDWLLRRGHEVKVDKNIFSSI